MAERKGRRAVATDRTDEAAAGETVAARAGSAVADATAAQETAPGTATEAPAGVAQPAATEAEAGTPAAESPRAEPAVPEAEPPRPAEPVVPTSPPVAAPPPPGGFGMMLAGAVIGAALVGGGLGWFAWTKGAFEDLRPRLAALESASGTAANRTALAELTSRIGTIEGRIEALARATREASAQGPQDAARLGATLQEAVAGLKREVEAARSAAGEAMSAARAAQGRAASAVEASAAPRPLPGEAAARLEEIDRRLGELAGRRTGMLAARLIVAQRLAERVRLDAGFQPELEALRRLGADQGLLAALAPFAAAGLPKPADLAAALRSAAPPPPAAAAPAAPAGLLDRLASNAANLVRIERAGAPRPAAGDPLAPVAAALQAGDEAKALAAIAALPPERRTALADLAARIEARRKAVEAARGLVETSLADLGRGG